MPESSPARYVAPLALAVVAIAFFAIMASNGGDRVAAGGQGAAAPTAVQRAERTARAPKRTYVVRAGDVASMIAERAGISLQAMEALNPGIDLRTIRPGQKLKLAR